MYIKKNRRLSSVLLSLSFVFCFSAQAHEKISKEGLSLLVLGSGGPVTTNKRTSASYLVLTDGKPRVLMDAGGGAIARIGQAGVNLKDLDIVLLSHLHLDHTADLAPIIKMMYFQNRAAGQQRTAPIHIYGAGENATPAFSSTEGYINSFFNPETGIERYLHGFVPAINAGTFSYMAHNISADTNEPMSTILSTEDGLVIKAIGVKHGPVPAVAYRIEYKGKSIVYSGDTSSKTDNMIQLSEGADLLVYDTAILDDSPAPFINLHTTPTRMGEVASAANVKKLLLSHITPITERKTHSIRHTLRHQGFNGKVKVARDLRTIRLGVEVE